MKHKYIIDESEIFTHFRTPRERMRDNVEALIGTLLIVGWFALLIIFTIAWKS